MAENFENQSPAIVIAVSDPLPPEVREEVRDKLIQASDELLYLARLDSIVGHCIELSNDNSEMAWMMLEVVKPLIQQTIDEVRCIVARSLALVRTPRPERSIP